MAEIIKAIKCPSCGAPLKHGQKVCQYCGCGLDGVPVEKNPNSMTIDGDNMIGTMTYGGVTFNFRVKSLSVTDYPVDSIEVTTLGDARVRRICGAKNNLASDFTLEGYIV